MKQKLLNLITWRATLLVALLCTSFGNAWGQDYTEQISFASGNNITDNNNHTYTSAFFTGYLRSVVVDCTIEKKGKDQNADVAASFDNSSLGDATTITSSNGTCTYSVEGDTKHSKSKTVSVTIKYNGNKTLTVNSITVTYTPTTSITLSENCYDVVDVENNTQKYYGTYSNSSPFVVPEDLTVSKVSVSGGTLTVTDLSGTIPANTGVMVSSTSPGEKIVKLNNPTGSYTAVTDNMLRPTGDNGITATAMGNADSGCQFYYLTMNGSQIGFYRRNNDGSAFDMNTNTAKNKAYLAVPSNQVGNVKGFEFSDTVDGIKAVETEKAESNAIYNLAGQRVSKMQKGIYVVNGKKMLVK